MSLRFGILGLLAEEPLHGYELKVRFELMFGGATEVNVGQVYGTLTRLERDGLIKAVGGRGDRQRLAYEATPSGRDAFEEWFSSPDNEPVRLRRDLYVKALLGVRLHPERLPGLLRQERQANLRRLRDLSTLEDRAGGTGNGDVALLYRAAALHVDADLSWLDQWEAEHPALGHGTGASVRGESGHPVGDGESTVR